jgi:hypothetical protein
MTPSAAAGFAFSISQVSGQSAGANDRKFEELPNSDLINLAPGEAQERGWLTFIAGEKLLRHDMILGLALAWLLILVGSWLGRQLLRQCDLSSHEPRRSTRGYRFTYPLRSTTVELAPWKRENHVRFFHFSGWNGLRAMSDDHNNPRTWLGGGRTLCSWAVQNETKTYA